MPETESNLLISEEFIRSVLENNFKQQVDPDTLRSAATKLCEALPRVRQKEAA